MNKPDKIITHHAVSSTQNTAKEVGQWHFDRWGGYSPSTIRNDVIQYAGYHYIIEWDGTIVQARALTDEGIHCRGQNFSSIGVCFIGNFDNHYPSKEQEESFKKLYAEIGNSMPIYPHRKYANKSCHGSLLDDDYFTNLVDQEYQVELFQQIKMLASQLLSLLLQERMK